MGLGTSGPVIPEVSYVNCKKSYIQFKEEPEIFLKNNENAKLNLKVTKDEFAELFLMINYCESIGDKLLGNEICFSVIF